MDFFLKLIKSFQKAHKSQPVLFPDFALGFWKFVWKPSKDTNQTSIQPSLQFLSNIHNQGYNFMTSRSMSMTVPLVSYNQWAFKEIFGMSFYKYRWKRSKLLLKGTLYLIQTVLRVMSTNNILFSEFAHQRWLGDDQWVFSIVIVLRKNSNISMDITINHI